VAGFTVVFVATGAVASGVGHLIGSHKQDLTVASGGVVIALGVILLVGALPAAVWTRLGAGASGRLGAVFGAEHRFNIRPETLGMWAAPITGMAFAFAWTPCIGPVLASVLGLAAVRSTLAGAILLLFVYSLGLGVPFLVTGVAFSRLTGFSPGPTAYGSHPDGGGAVLVAFGALLVAGDLGWLSSQFSDAARPLGPAPSDGELTVTCRIGPARSRDRAGLLPAAWNTHPSPRSIGPQVMTSVVRFRAAVALAAGFPRYPVSTSRSVRERWWLSWARTGRGRPACCAPAPACCR